MADSSSNLEILISAVDEASAAFESVGESMQGMAEQASESATAQQASFDLLNEVLQTDNADIQAAILATGQTYAQVTAQMEEDNAAEAQSADEAATATASSWKSSATALGVAAGIAYAAIQSAVDSAVSSAMRWDETNAVIANNLKDIGSSIPLSQIDAYAETIQNTTLFSQQQALSAEAIVTGYKNLAPEYQNITMLSADLATKIQQFTGAATADMPAAMKILTNSLNDPVAGLSQLQRQAGVDIPAATVTMIKNLANAGDTAGADSVILQALTGQVGGLAEAAESANGGGLVQFENQMAALGTTIANSGLLTSLNSLAQALIPIIQGIGEWTTEHPKLTEALIAGVVVFTALLAVLSLVAIVVGAIVTAFGAAAIGIAAAVALIAAIVITNFAAIKDTLVAGWDAQLSAWSSLWVNTLTVLTNAHQFLVSGIHSLVSDVSSIWDTGLTDMATLAQNVWNTISNTFRTGVNDVISAINGFINALDSIHISIPAIQIPGTKIGTPALDLGFSIPDIPMLAAGGVVYNPVLAMIGEQGPEAVVPLSQFAGAGGGGFGGPQITINIDGGMFLNPQSVKQLTDQIAKSITQNLRVGNYRS